MSCFLKVTDLSKAFRQKAVFSNLNLEIERGEIYGLVGNNGSGKTTLLRVIAGMLKQDSGEVCFADKNGKIGVLIENPGLFRDMTAYENLKAKALCIGYNCNTNMLLNLLELVGLGDVGKKLVLKFSMGMKQRLGLALALLGDPDFLVLDEPINGLDPQGIHDMRAAISRIYSEKRTTMMISSHILDELERIATKFCFLHDHRIIKQISKDEMVKERGEQPIDEYYLKILKESENAG